MPNIYTKWRARRRWAHVQACHQFGLRSAHVAGTWARHRKYDSLFREYMRIAQVMQEHGRPLN